MARIEDSSRLRELCEKASREYDHDKLIDLVRQINDLLEKGQARRDDPQSPASDKEKKGSSLLWGAAAVTMIAESAEEWLEFYPWISPARS